MTLANMLLSHIYCKLFNCPKYQNSKNNVVFNCHDLVGFTMDKNESSSLFFVLFQQAVQLGGRERLISFCEAVQRSCPIGSYIKPTAGVTPGYASEV